MNRWLDKIIGGAGIAFWAVLLASLAAQQPEYGGCYLLLFAIATMLIVSGSAVFSRKLPWYSPHAWFCLALFLIYVAAATAQIYYHDDIPSRYYRRPFLPDETFRALEIVLVSIACYMLGWRYGPKKQTMPRRLEWFLTDTPAVRANFDYVCFALMIAGVCGYLYIFSFAGGLRGQLQSMGDRYESLYKAGAFMFNVGNLAYMGILLYFSRHGLNLISKIVIPTFFLVLLIAGSRSFAGMFLIAFLAIYAFRVKGKLPLVWWVAGLSMLFMLMTYWVLLRRTAGDLGAAADAYKQSMSTTQGAVMQSLGNLMFMANHIEITNGIGEGLVPVQWGKTLLVVLYIIPNRIWPKDFITSSSKLYLEVFYPHAIGHVSLGCPLIEEFYLNFLWPGVVIFSLLCGILVRWLDSTLIRHPHRRYQVAHIVICGLLLGLSVKVVKQGFSQGIVIWYQIILPLLIVYFPNLPLAMSPPADDAAVELGDVPPASIEATGA